MNRNNLDAWYTDIEQAAESRKPLLKLIKEYTGYLAEYAQISPDRDKIFFNGNPKEGYKFHLNVKPENVRKVSAFLKLLELEHKYLTGGEPESGKVFTVYTGSKANTENVVRQIADDSTVSALLEPMPVSDDPSGSLTPNGEVPYAPNIYGRFVGSKDNYNSKFPRLGIAILKGTEFKTLDESFNITNSSLIAKYGDYFGGGISYYQPGK